jgi:hypothetical protein
MWLLDLRQGKWRETELIQQVYAAWVQTPGIVGIGFEAIGFAKVFSHLFTAEGDRRGFYLPMLKLERDTRRTKNTRIQVLEPAWQAGRIRALTSCPALEAFLDEGETWRPDQESSHDDLLDAVADTFQLRQRPQALQDSPRTQFYDDPTLAARARWEAEVLQRRPGLNQADLAMGWLFHQVQAREQERADEIALGAGPEAGW